MGWTRRLAFIVVTVAVAVISSACTQLGINIGPQLDNPTVIPTSNSAPAQAAAPAQAEVVVVGRGGWPFSEWRVFRANISQQSVTWKGPKVTRGSRLTVLGDMVVATKGVSMVVMELKTGEERFRKTLTGPIETNCGTKRDDPLIDLPLDCVTATGDLIAVRLAEAVVAFDTKSGAERWRTPLTKAYGPLTGNGPITTIHRTKDATPELTVIDPATGNPQHVALLCPPGPGRPKATPVTQALLAPNGSSITIGTGSSSGCLRQIELPSFKERYTLNGGSTMGVTGMGELSLHGDLVTRPFNPAGSGASAGVTVIPPDGQPRIIRLAPQHTPDDLGNPEGGTLPLLIHEKANPAAKYILLSNIADGNSLWIRNLTDVKQMEINPGPVELRCPTAGRCHVTTIDRNTGKSAQPVDLPTGVDRIAARAPTYLVLAGRSQLSAVDPTSGKVIATWTYQG